MNGAGTATLAGNCIFSRGVMVDPGFSKTGKTMEVLKECKGEQVGRVSCTLSPLMEDKGQKGRPPRERNDLN